MSLQTEKDRNSRRFTRPIWTKESERFTPRCFEVEMIQGDERTITADDLGKP